MKRSFGLAAALLLFSLRLPAQEPEAPPLPQTRPITVRDLLAFERLSEPQRSPDGKTVAYAVLSVDLEASKTHTALWLLDLASGERRVFVEAPANSPRWAPDGQSLYFLSSRGGRSQVWRQPVAGGAAVAVTDLPLDVGSFNVSPAGDRLALTLEVFPDCATLACTSDRLGAIEQRKATGQLYDRLFVRHWDTWSDGRRSQLFSVALDAGGRAGEALPISRGLDADVPSKPFGGDSEIVFTPDGASLIFAARSAGRDEPWSTNFDLWQAPADGSAAARNLTADNPAWDTAPRVTPDGSTLIYLAMARPGYEADRFSIMAQDLASGRTRPIAPNWDRSPGAIALSADGKTLFATADHLGQTPLFAIGVADGRVTRLTSEGSVGGFSAGASDVIYSHDTLAAPAELHAVPVAGGKPRKLTTHNDERLAGLSVGGYEQFRFAGHDGEIVHGYLMRPSGFEAGKSYPVAFIIHGGPQGSMGNHWHYRWNPAVFAGMGYAVVFIDFHGSTGYGQAFTDSIRDDWGGKPLEDLKAGWAYALAQYPFLDGKRACALGASFGGFMINWIAGHWADGFSCLVNHDGVFDQRSMYYATEELWFPEWEHGGPYFENPEAHEKHDPAAHVSKWRTPMLVVHSALDFRVPLEQGLATFTALQRRGIPSQFLMFPDENHWVLQPNNSIQWHETIETWMKRWTGEVTPAR